MTDFNYEELAEHGLIPLPISMPTKAPANGFSQLEWYRARPSVDEIKAVWAKYGKGATGIGLIAGHGLELLDIDTKNDPEKDIDKRLITAIKAECPEILEKVVLSSTVSGGIHMWYLVDDDRRSTNLAAVEYSDDDRFILGPDYENKTHGVVVETRGAGGYGVISPTEGYVIVKGKFTAMKSLLPEERELLWDISRSFNTWVKPQTYIQGEYQSGGDRPGDDFNARCSVPEFVSLLESGGWSQISTRGNTVYLNRPGAKHKNRTDGIIVQNKKLFVPYSTQVDHFEAEKGYNPFRVYTFINHAGDFRASTKALSNLGYGKKEDSGPPAIPIEEDELEKLKFRLAKRPAIDFNLYIIEMPKTPFGHPERYGIAFPGALIPVVGKEKSRKSTVLTSIIAAALTGFSPGGFMYEETGDVLWIDTEQPEFYFWLTQWRICVQVGHQSPRLHSYMLRKLDPAARKDAVTRLIEKIKPKILVIDGIADMIKSVNSEDECKEFVDTWLMPIASSGITVFPVLHLNKGDGQMAGWMGTILSRKGDGTMQATPYDDFSVDVMMRNARAERPPVIRLQTDKGMHGILYKDFKPDLNYKLGYENEAEIREAASAPYATPPDQPTDEDDLPF